MIRYTGNGFLYHMVRILAGTLIEIGLEERSPQEMKGNPAETGPDRRQVLPRRRKVCFWRGLCMRTGSNMTDFLVKTFVKDFENAGDTGVRTGMA